jgi:hypothetical protein
MLDISFFFMDTTTKQQHEQYKLVLHPHIPYLLLVHFDRAIITILHLALLVFGLGESTVVV